ncbi:MAG: ribosomal RNA small subunit methyltransferase A [Gemmatimonadaceae bacterium]|nr:ribosomal RNA small subunit methyltransferase A [Gemmatimonadaceae bacterium]
MRGARVHPPVLKRFGQHFLFDRTVLEATADAVAPAPDETVIEIGAGRGALTDLLACRCRRLIAVEIDRALASVLRERFAGSPHVEIVEIDVLDADLGAMGGGPFVVAGNVPYYITTPILFHVLQPPFPRHAVFLVQREVAERIVASPGSKVYGALTVNVQAISDAEIIRHVPPAAFRPRPRVDSTVIRITPRKQERLIAPPEVRPFRIFVQAAFGMRRKQMANVLRAVRGLSAADAGAALELAGIDPAARPETLSPGQFALLMRTTAETAIANA